VSSAKVLVNGYPLYLMRDDTTLRTQVMVRRLRRDRYLGEFYEQNIDELHLHLCDLNPGIEVWEPERQWPWRTHHKTVSTRREALAWLLYRAHMRGDL